MEPLRIIQVGKYTYRLWRMIGAGVHSEVYVASDQDACGCAVKRLGADHEEHPTRIAAGAREIAQHVSLSWLNDPNREPHPAIVCPLNAFPAR